MPKSKGAAVCRGLKTRRIWNQNLLRSSLLKHVSHLWLKPDVFSCYKSTTLLPLLRKKNLLNNTSFVFNFPTPHFFSFISYLITTRTHIVYFAARHMSSRADWDILGFGQHFGCCHESSQGHLLLNSSTPNFLLSPCSPHITSCFPPDTSACKNFSCVSHHLVVVIVSPSHGSLSCGSIHISVFRLTVAQRSLSVGWCFGAASTTVLNHVVKLRQISHRFYGFIH